MTSADCTVLVFSGRKVDLRAPGLTNFTIEDFAVPLSREPRWRGNTFYPYAVSQHCVHTSRIVAPRFALTALGHDLEAAITGALITPVKALFGAVMVRGALAPLKREIARRFGFIFSEPQAVQLADRISLATEIRDLGAPYSGDPAQLPEPGIELLRRLTATEACEEFLERYYERVEIRQLATTLPRKTG